MHGRVAAWSLEKTPQSGCVTPAGIDVIRERQAGIADVRDRQRHGHGDAGVGLDGRGVAEIGRCGAASCG